MRKTGQLVIDTSERFEHLPRAPIVEAVVDIRAQPVEALDEAVVKACFEGRLTGYEFLDSQRGIQIEQEFSIAADKPSAPILRDLGWKGLRFRSADKKYIAQFNRDGFVLSRLEPYQSWEIFFEETVRLWRVYVELARPVEIVRAGLRFINKIQLPLGELQFERYLHAPPISPKGFDLPFFGFMHRDVLAVPDHPYAINIIRTIQPTTTGSATRLSLIIDIDAFTAHAFPFDEALLKRRLLEMRWLKNKAFFGSITRKAKELFL